MRNILNIFLKRVAQWVGGWVGMLSAAHQFPKFFNKDRRRKRIYPGSDLGFGFSKN